MVLSRKEVQTLVLRNQEKSFLERFHTPLSVLFHVTVIYTWCNVFVYKDSTFIFNRGVLELLCAPYFTIVLLEIITRSFNNRSPERVHVSLSHCVVDYCNKKQGQLMSSSTVDTHNMDYRLHSSGV